MLRFFDPDPSSYPYMWCVDFGDGLAQCLHAHPVPCTEPVAWAENTVQAVAPGVIPETGFSYVYDRPGSYEVHAWVLADEGACNIYVFEDEAEASLTIEVGWGQ